MDWGRTGRFWGMGMGPIWELVCEPHQVLAHNPIVMHSWGLDEAGGEGESASLLSSLGGTGVKITGNTP